MIGNPPVAYRIEWRSHCQKMWIRTVACHQHVQLIASRVPIRMLGEPTEPVQNCVICQAAKTDKLRKKAAGSIKDSPLTDSLKPQPFKPKLLRA